MPLPRALQRKFAKPDHSAPGDFVKVKGARRSNNDQVLGAMYGVSALAGRVFVWGHALEAFEIPGEPASHRLKPGLHTGTPGALSAIDFKGHDGVPRNWWLTIRQQAGIFKS